MRVCLLLPDQWGAAKGGAEYQAHLLADYIQRSTAHEVVYLTKRPPADTAAFAYRIEAIGSRIPDRFGQYLDAPQLLRALARIRPDVVLQRVACAYTGIAARYCARSKSKLVWHVSSDADVGPDPQVLSGRFFDWPDRWLFGYGIRHAHAIVAQTQHQARLLETHHRRHARAVIRNFSDRPADAGRKSCRFTVLWIANLKRLKRPERLLDLARILTNDDVHIRVIGRPERSEWCDDLLNRLEACPNVEYLGELAQERVNTEIERAHVVINTSDFEGMPNTFIQAWLRGVPTVTLGVDPDGLIAMHGLGVVTSGVDEMKRALLSYRADRDSLALAGDRARALAAKLFSSENARELVDLMVEVVAER